MNFKKAIITAATIVLVFIVTVFFLVIFPFLGTKKIEAGSQFAGGKIYNVIDGMSQAFIIDGGNRTIGLIDAGNSPDGKPILDALAVNGYKPSDVKAIFLTHGHHDHVAAVKQFPEAKIYALKEEVEIAEGMKNNHSPISFVMSAEPTGFKVTNILKDGEKVNFGALTVEVFSIPGHTQGSAAYFISGVLFLGDAALSSSGGSIRHAVWAFSTDVDQQNISLKALAGRLAPRKDEVKFITFSHSGYLDTLQPLSDFASKVKLK